jgi:hypothetical protein
MIIPSAVVKIPEPVSVQLKILDYVTGDFHNTVVLSAFLFPAAIFYIDL